MKQVITTQDLLRGWYRCRDCDTVLDVEFTKCPVCDIKVVYSRALETLMASSEVVTQTLTVVSKPVGRDETIRFSITVPNGNRFFCFIHGPGAAQIEPHLKEGATLFVRDSAIYFLKDNGEVAHIRHDSKTAIDFEDVY